MAHQEQTNGQGKLIKDFPLEIDSRMAISVGKAIFLLTGVNLEDTLNACLESMRKLGERAAITSEKLKQLEEMEDSDPILGLLHAICDDDTEALSQLVSKYYLHNHNLSKFERVLVSQQLEKGYNLSIASSAVLIWLGTFSLNYSAYFSLRQEKREEIMVSLMASACRKELLPEIVDPRGRMSIEEYEEYAQYRLKKGFPLEEYRLATYDNQPEDTLLDLEKLGFDIDTLTKGEIRILYDELNAYNQGVEGGSKQGRSRRQHWGKDYTKNIKMLERLKAKRQKT